MVVVAEILLVAVVAWMLAGVGALVFLRRRNRVSPKVRSRAPLSWMASPRRAAVAHRRLRRAVQGAHAALGADGAGAVAGELRSLVTDLERQAAAVDDHLVLAARCSPVVRRSLVRGLEGQVREVEAVSARIATILVGRPVGSSELGADSVRRISDRLDALDAAHAELAALEATYASPSFVRRASGGTHGAPGAHA